MSTFVAMIRGINVSGNRRVKMEDLRSLFVDLGYDDVSTYIQSGNVIFGSRANSASYIAADIEKGIAEQLELEVAVVIRTSEELADVAAGNPFVAEGADATKLHVTFLSEWPDPARLSDGENNGADRYRLVGREVYADCPGGYGRTKFDNSYFEKHLGVAATTRSWKTVIKLLELSRR